MTVHDLIEMLQRIVALDPTKANQFVLLEGCDCASEVVGWSSIASSGDTTEVVLRVNGGVFERDMGIEL